VDAVLGAAPGKGEQARRMIVSLQVGGFFFALANVICVAILAWTYLSVKLEPKTIEVKASHVSLISQPDTIARLILEAAGQT